MGGNTSSACKTKKKSATTFDGAQMEMVMYFTAYSQRITSDEGASPATAANKASFRPLWEDFVAKYFRWIDSLDRCVRTPTSHWSPITIRNKRHYYGQGFIRRECQNIPKHKNVHFFHTKPWLWALARPAWKTKVVAFRAPPRAWTVENAFRRPLAGSLKPMDPKTTEAVIAEVSLLLQCIP